MDFLCRHLIVRWAHPGRTKLRNTLKTESLSNLRINKKIRISESLRYVVKYENMAWRSRQIYEHWTAMQDIKGPTTKLPFLIRRLFWTQFLIHWQRILISAFVYVNGLDPFMFIEWVTLKGPGRALSAFNHFNAL